MCIFFFFFSSRRRHTRCGRDWSSDVCSSDLLPPQDAVDRPRFHAAGGVVNAEAGVDEAALESLEAAGRTVRRWPGLHHYFGGVSAIGRDGAAADPRRSGAVLTV